MSHRPPPPPGQLEVGEDDLPIVDQYTYHGVDISKDCCWDAHIPKVIGKGELGKMDAILTNPHLDTRTKICIPMIVVVPKRLCAGEVMGREREVRKKTGNSADDSSPKHTRMLKHDE